MVSIRRLKPARVDSVLTFSVREFQVLEAKYLKEWRPYEVEAGLHNDDISVPLRE